MYNYTEVLYYADYYSACAAYLEYYLCVEVEGLKIYNKGYQIIFVLRWKSFWRIFLMLILMSTGDGESGKQQEWRGIVTRFLPIGLCLVAVMQWRAYRKYSGERVASQLEVDAYTILPLKAFSRCWGMLADLNQPEFMRPYIYGMYINLFGVNLTEAANEDLKSYQSLSEFFVR